MHACRFHPVRVLLNNIRWSLMDNKFASEQQLRQAGIPFTIVRPGGLNNTPAGEQQLQAGADASMLGTIGLHSSAGKTIGRAACAAEGATRGVGGVRCAAVCLKVQILLCLLHSVCECGSCYAGIEVSLPACCAVLCCAAEVDAKKESLMGSISRADVAAVCVEALSNPAAKVRAAKVLPSQPSTASAPKHRHVAAELQAACSPPNCASHVGLWPLHSTTVPARACR